LRKLKRRSIISPLLDDSQSEYITNPVCSKAIEQLSKSVFDCTEQTVRLITLN